MAFQPSATTLQKTFKEEVHTLYARASIGAAFANTAIITTNGASKGVVSITESADGVFNVVLDRGYVQYLGAPVVVFKGSGAVNAPIVVVTAEDAAAGTFSFRTQIVGGTTGVHPTSGLTLCLTVAATRSNVY